MNSKIIFVSGIHGVGKTTICQHIAKTFDIKHYACSELISSVRNEGEFKNKNTKEIEKNQDLLLIAANSLLKDEQWYLLDGHFCLLNQRGEVTKIPISTYANLNIKLIIGLEDSPSRIIERLKTRDGVTYDLESINRFQNEELKYAMEVSRFINTHCHRFNLTNEIKEVHKIIRNTMRSYD